MKNRLVISMDYDVLDICCSRVDNLKNGNPCSLLCVESRISLNNNRMKIVIKVINA